ncbi:MAG: hypothetical protein B6D36_03415 [Planctomycetes bacterium UTPLA1]|nr:MAG: hypothetical protein B6D36_03415 [Planctomycetes bacterium UTPLA1]
MPGDSGMPTDNYEVVDVLMLVGNIVPIAFYFLILGLVNSHARPCLITSRSDFLALTGVLLPVLLWPVPEFVRSGMYVPLAGGMLLAATVFYYLLPKRDAGFVIYNISLRQCVRLIEQATTRLDLAGRRQGNCWMADDGSLRIELRPFPLLHNVALHVEPTDSKSEALVPLIGMEIDRQLSTVSQLPSNMSAGMVLAGVTLLLLPMWMVSRHVDDLVDAMLHLFG